MKNTSKTILIICATICVLFATYLFALNDRYIVVRDYYYNYDLGVKCSDIYDKWTQEIVIVKHNKIYK
ncbi:hypothetical protein FACS189434_06750 [Bacteroidia bacterium]|nr:hypothetical protein FACS189434_06750 [Bacteroidia bacterium]